MMEPWIGSDSSLLNLIAAIASKALHWWAFMILYEWAGSPEIVSWAAFWLYLAAAFAAAFAIMVVLLIVNGLLEDADE